MTGPLIVQLLFDLGVQSLNLLVEPIFQIDRSIGQVVKVSPKSRRPVVPVRLIQADSQYVFPLPEALLNGSQNFSLFLAFRITRSNQ